MDEPIGKYFIENGSLRPHTPSGSVPQPPGPSVYEVVRIIDGRPLFLEDHVRRLARSASLAGYRLDVAEGRIREIVAELTHTCGFSSVNVKIVYNNGQTRKSALTAFCIRSRFPNDEMYRIGVRVGLLRGERSTPAVKRSDTPVRKEADALLEDGTFYEVLLVNGTGYVTEGSRTNVFFIADDTLVTPPAHSVLPGITRCKVFDIALRENIGLIERPVHTSDIGGFDALFLTGTSAQVLPVRSVDDISFSVDNPLMRRVMELYGRLIESYLGAPGRTA